MNYARITNFGSASANSPNSNPLLTCMGNTVNNGFVAGGTGLTIAGTGSRNCQAFMSDYCAENWDGVCEYASMDRNNHLPNTLQNCGQASETESSHMTQGEILIRNTAAKKYLQNMQGNYGIEFRPFDPTNASSPMVGFFTGSCGVQGNNQCMPTYAVDPATIDQDPVMNKILNKPTIAWGILVNIYNNAVNNGTLEKLKGTRLYSFFQSPHFQKYNQTSMYLSANTLSGDYMNSVGCQSLGRCQ